jgi:hypothetical protein
MISPNHGQPSLLDNSTAPMQPVAETNSVRIAKNTERETAQDALRIRLWSLQQWTCELLIKNQQLRMALSEVKETERQR